MLYVFLTTSWISLMLHFLPLIKNVEAPRPLPFSLPLLRSILRWNEWTSLPGKGARVISTVATFFSCIMKARASSARPSNLGSPPNPRQMAHKIVDFPANTRRTRRVGQHCSLSRTRISKPTRKLLTRSIGTNDHVEPETKKKTRINKEWETDTLNMPTGRFHWRIQLSCQTAMLRLTVDRTQILHFHASKNSWVLFLSQNLACAPQQPRGAHHRTPWS